MTTGSWCWNARHRRLFLSKEAGFDVCAVTLRTASGQALASCGRCDIQVQVPPIATPAKVTFEVVDVRYPILSVAGPVANGHRVAFRGQEAELRTAHRAVAPPTRIRGLWYLLVWIDNNRELRACRQWCSVSCVSARLGHPHEVLEQTVYIDRRERFGNTRTHR